MRGKDFGLPVLTVELNPGPASSARRFIDSLSPESSPVRVAHDHSHCPVLAPATLAALPSTRAIETRSLPTSLASTHRGFAFYVALPKSSIPSIATCSMSLAFPRLHSRTRNRSCSRILPQITSHGSVRKPTTGKL